MAADLHHPRQPVRLQGLGGLPRRSAFR